MSRTWHKGPPPHVGWWNASGGRNHEAWRWWNGRRWSSVAWSFYGAEAAGKEATQTMRGRMGYIEWTDYWPKNARVPRTAP